MVMSPAKFTILISWSPICTRLILLSASMKLANTSAAIIYNTDESGHPWRTPCIRVKRSDRRPFILILDWMLVYATLIVQIIFFHIQTFAKQKRQNPDQLYQGLWGYYREVLIQFTWNINYITDNRKCV